MTDDMTDDGDTRVFLSYSRADIEIAERLAHDLERAGLQVWLDHWELNVGDDLEQRINEGVDAADFLLVLLTESSVTRRAVEHEWKRKVDSERESQRISVIPVWSGECIAPDFLAQRSHAQIGAGSYRQGVEHLLDMLRHYGGDDRITLPKDALSASSSHDDDPEFLPIVTPITVELASSLGFFFDDLQGRDGRGPRQMTPDTRMGQLTEQMRELLREELGLPFPGVRFRLNETDMPPDSGLLMIHEIPVVMFTLDPDAVFVDADPASLAELGIAGAEASIARNVAGAWVPVGRRDDLIRAGFDSIEADASMLLILMMVLVDFAPDFIDMDVTRRLLDEAALRDPEIVAATVPGAISLFELTDVLRRLLAERVAISDLERILSPFEGLTPRSESTDHLAERARQALAAQITRGASAGDGTLYFMALDDDVERMFETSIQTTSSGSYIALEPDETSGFLASVRETIADLQWGDEPPPIVTTPVVRRYARKVVELEFPDLQVLSTSEVSEDVDTRCVATLRRSPETNGETS